MKYTAWGYRYRNDNSFYCCFLWQCSVALSRPIFYIIINNICDWSASSSLLYVSHGSCANSCANTGGCLSPWRGPRRFQYGVLGREMVRDTLTTTTAFWGPYPSTTPVQMINKSNEIKLSFTNQWKCWQMRWQNGGQFFKFYHTKSRMLRPMISFTFSLILFWEKNCSIRMICWDLLSPVHTWFWWFSAAKSFSLLPFSLLLVSSTLFLFFRCFHHSVAQPCALHALVDCCVQSVRDEQDLQSIFPRCMSFPVLLLFQFNLLFFVFLTSASLRQANHHVKFMSSE